MDRLERFVGDETAKIGGRHAGDGPRIVTNGLQRLIAIPGSLGRFEEEVRRSRRVFPADEVLGDNGRRRTPRAKSLV